MNKKCALVVMGFALPSLAVAGDAKKRPEGPTFGLGAGLSVPASSFAPTVGSLRIRFSDDFTLEPGVGYAGVMTEPERGDETSSSSMSVGTQARYRFANKGRVDALAIGGAGYLQVNSTVEPQRGAETVDNNSALYLDAGLALDYWIHPHWSVSMDGSLLGVIQSTREYGANNTQEDETTAFGISSAPSMRVMVHCYL